MEDDLISQMLFMKQFLDNKKGCYVEIAKEGAIAKKMPENKQYYIIILKQNLPNISGIEMIEHVRNHKSEKSNTIPILVASGSPMLEQQEEFLAMGASSFLAKPDTKSELFKNLEKLAR
ncbi:response regulator [Patiriisocius sp. Uisw_017]|uniref:response regulator n=1 Tax=Patiriisocius sp. Uisw_017 TaxID=3230968 RepID=UPI0039ED0D67